MSVPADIFGPSTSSGDVARALLGVLSTEPAGVHYPLIAYYLADRARKAGLDPKAFRLPVTYRPAADFTAWGAELLPMVVAVVKPAQPPVRIDPGEYAQMFEAQVGVVVKATDSEQDAYMLADEYGIALTLAILQNGNLGVSPYDPSAAFAISTVLADFPTPEFAETATEARNVMHSIATFHIRVAPVLQNWDGPKAYPADPYAAPGDWPQVTSVTTTLTAESETALQASLSE